MASTTTNKAVKQDLDPTQREFLALTQAQPKFTITLPLKSREAKENEADVRVQVNGVIWQIKRGVRVQVPQTVMEALIAGGMAEPQTDEQESLRPAKTWEPNVPISQQDIAPPIYANAQTA